MFHTKLHFICFLEKLIVNSPSCNQIHSHLHIKRKQDVREHEVAFRQSVAVACRYDNSSLASGSQEFNRRITDLTHDIQALGFQDTHGDIEEEDYYL